MTNEIASHRRETIFISGGFALSKSHYYIKVSGIASGNKLIKTIRYPHM